MIVIQESTHLQKWAIWVIKQMCSLPYIRTNFWNEQSSASADGELWGRISAFPLLIVNNLSPREAQNYLQWLTVIIQPSSYEVNVSEHTGTGLYSTCMHRVTISMNSTHTCSRNFPILYLARSNKCSLWSWSKLIVYFPPCKKEKKTPYN